MPLSVFFAWPTVISGHFRKHKKLCGSKASADRQASAEVRGAAAQTEAWETHKAAERAARAAAQGRRASLLDGVSTALPAVVRAA